MHFVIMENLYSPPGEIDYFTFITVELESLGDTPVHNVVISQSSYFCMGTRTLPSSAYRCQSRLVMSGRLLICMIKNRGPSKDPCGTPLMTGLFIN